MRLEPNTTQVVTSRGARFIDNWTNHINGAAALLELRGVEQLQEEQGLQLFLQLRYQIVRSSFAIPLLPKPHILAN